MSKEGLHKPIDFVTIQRPTKPLFGMHKCQYLRQNYEQFIDLQIPVYPTLEESFNSYTSQVHMEGDNKYSTEEYGLQDALKGVKVAYLPPVLMLQLKRFQYSFQEEKNIKILDRMEYQEFFDFSKWSTSHEKQLYQLYAVLVHQGARAESGHYYNYIKTEQSWFKFNDQLVKKVTKDEVFKYNFGGYHQSLQFDAKQMKFQKKFIQSKSTAYMLVYIKTSIKKYLMDDKKEYPEWLLKKDQNKMKMDQLRKNKKFYLYNVKIIDWENDLKGKKCSQFGFLDLQILENIKTIVDQISKDSTILQWIEPSNKMQIQDDAPKSKNLKRLKKSSSQVGVYSYFVTPEREILFSYVNYAQHKMGQLFKNITEPIVFKTPIKAKKSEYLVVCKRFILRKSYEQFERQFIYQDCFVIEKQILGKDFLQFLQARSIKQEIIQSQPKQKSKFNYYVENEKIGLQNVQTIGGRIPATIPNSNQLFICIIEQLPQSLTKQQQQVYGFQTFYKTKRNTISLIVINQKTREAYQLKQLNVMMSCQQLRKCIYQILLQNKSLQYESAQNIVLKMKQKKTSKIYHEITSSQKILNDLIKHDNKIEFSYSSITVQSRLVRRQLIFYYRFKSFMLSDPIKIIVEKNQGSENIVSIIKSHQKTQQYLFNQGFDTNQVELFLLGKDKMIINDHIDKEGKIFSKGDLESVLKKEKFSILIVQGAKQISISKRSPLIQKQEIKEENPQDQQEKEEDHSCIIFLHHVSQNLDRVGFPLQFRVDKKMELVQLRNRILDLIGDQTYQFQGKTFKCNVFKLGLRLFAKDMKRIVQLDDYQSLEQINELNIEQKQPVISKSQKIENVPEQKQQTKRKMSIETESNIKKAVQAVQEQQQKPLEKQYQRIQTVFVKAKYLKVQVVHYQMIRPNIALKFNVDN